MDLFNLCTRAVRTGAYIAVSSHGMHHITKVKWIEKLKSARPNKQATIEKTELH